MILLYFCVCVCAVFVRNIFLLYLLNNCLITDTIFNELQSNGFMKGERSFELYSLPVFVFFSLFNKQPPPSSQRAYILNGPNYFSYLQLTRRFTNKLKKQKWNKFKWNWNSVQQNHIFHNFYSFLDYKNRITSLWVNLNVSLFLLIPA